MKPQRTSPNQQNLKCTKSKLKGTKQNSLFGRKGTRIESLRNKYNVTITTENKKDGQDNYCIIAIKGLKDNTDTAAKEIRQILD